MIRLELINKDNFDQVLDLEVAPKDQRRVASVEYSLAQAWLYRDSEDLFPYAVKSGQLTVGFLLLSYQPMENSYYIWRLLIDQKYQNQSFGKEVIRQVLQRARDDQQCHKVTVNYVIGNHKMRYILEKFGFQPVGLDGQEMKMELIVK
ncbi:MAG: GNAT family N-acetyltransferase [Streptococcus sp.]|nr:GNAT family N-acetyltransferase [Streptococcus sp.]MBP7054768.1 GNAT family N-acetyltransferase [Streptococcus sp.]MBP9623054.1 GNAT family N-acetyltransferase [Streptococcus sp.]